METITLGRSALKVSRLAYGCMRTVGTWDPKAVDAERAATASRAIHAAVDAGYTLFDHADIYCHGMCEKVFGDVLRDSPGLRDHMVIATKCGIRFPGDPKPDSPHRYDFSADHILWSCEQSLQRLRIETIDLYQLHRPDLLMNPAEIANAFAQLKRQGKVRYFGVSNFSPSFFSTLQQTLPDALVDNQVEISLGHLDTFYDGTLDQCLRDQITPMAWSPLAGGFLGTGASVGDQDPRRDVRLKLVELLETIAARYGVSRTVLSLAWLLKHPAGIVPIVGSANPAHIQDATRAADVNIDREDWYRLLVAARGQALP